MNTIDEAYTPFQAFDLAGGEKTQENHLLQFANTLGELLGFKVNAFYQFQVTSDTKEIEMSFVSPLQNFLNANRFTDHLNLQLFNMADHKIESGDPQNIKLTISKLEIYNYFYHMNLNFTEFLHAYDYSYQHTRGILFVTKEHCPIVYLKNQHDKIKSDILFLFNMYMYRNSSCVYYDRESQTSFLTVGINILKNGYINKNYFTLQNSDKIPKKDLVSNKIILLQINIVGIIKFDIKNQIYSDI